MTNQSVVTEPNEEVEGIGSPEDSILGEYPLDTMLIRNETRTIHDVLRRISQDNYIMDPDFQRDFIWPTNKQSKLIESVLMRIPLPVFYIAENEDGRVVVVDGLQRLSTFRNFVNGELRLRLPGQPELHNKQFTDLSPKLQNRIEDCNLILYIIDAKAPEQTRLDIFERVNSGIALSRQQMRNCLYVGPSTRFLKEEADTELFKKATGESLKPEMMRDREFINRFCAFKLFSPFNSYNGDMDTFLSSTLKHMNLKEPEEIQCLSIQLRRGLSNNYNVFDRNAFRKHTPVEQKRSVINASIWDVMVTGLARYEESKVEAHATKLREEFQRLLQNSTFNDAITYGTNQVTRVRRRFQEADNMLREVFGD